MQCQRRTDTTFACPLVGRRDLERRQAMHRDKVQRMRPAIDIKPPAPQPHLTLYGRDYAAKKRATTEAAFADLKMIQSIARTMTRKTPAPERSGPVSLNAESRKTEIFRIMKENHRLLDKLETLEPIVSTSDLLRSHKNRQRYTINVSHSKRLAGEYDNEVNKIKLEDNAFKKAQTDAILLRKERLRNSQGSMSMPSLTPMASTDPTALSSGGASAAPKQHGKPVITKKLSSSGGLGGSSSSKSGASPPAAKTAAGYQGGAAEAAPAEGDGIAKRDSKVQFLASDIPSPASENRQSEWERQGGPTPHPKKIPSELVYEDGAEVDPSPSDEPAAPPAEASEATRDLVVDEPAAPTAETPAEEKPVEEKAPAPAQEFDPEPEQKQEAAVDDMVFTGGVETFDDPPVGVAPAAQESMEKSQEYEDDFADDTQASIQQAVDETFDASAES